MQIQTSYICELKLLIDIVVCIIRGNKHYLSYTFCSGQLMFYTLSFGSRGSPGPCAPNHFSLTIKLGAGLEVLRSLLSARNNRKQPYRLASYQLLALVLMESAELYSCSARALRIPNRNGIPISDKGQLFQLGKVHTPNLQRSYPAKLLQPCSST